jgi:hypothetical protein
MKNFRDWLVAKDSFFISESAGGIYRAYHGGLWDGKKPLRVNGRGALGVGAYFTPDRNRAMEYARESLGMVVEVEIELQNPLVFGLNVHYGPVDALIALGMEKDKALDLVEKVEERYGYLGQQIMTKALSQGYDGLIQMQEHNSSEISEIVIWNRNKVKRILSVEKIN